MGTRALGASRLRYLSLTGLRNLCFSLVLARPVHQVFCQFPASFWKPVFSIGFGVSGLPLVSCQSLETSVFQWFWRVWSPAGLPLVSRRSLKTIVFHWFWRVWSPAGLSPVPRRSPAGLWKPLFFNCFGAFGLPPVFRWSPAGL